MSSPAKLSRRTLFTAVALSAITLLLFWQYVYRHGANLRIPLLNSDKTENPGLGPAPSAEADTEKTGGAGTEFGSTLIPPLSATHTTSSSAGTMNPSSGAVARPAVVLRQGTYLGGTMDAGQQYPKALEVFRGIPYAQTTAGENRFQVPMPLPESSEVYEALVFGQACPNAIPRNNPPEGEDCLNLNIYRPAGLEYNATAKAKRPKLPVVVYVHGGAFNSGTGVERNMGSFVAWAAHDLVGINFNYRVGALGFLPSALTAKEGLLNLGLRDQQLLFGWVRENVEAFGGDPDNVTIMGLSAGAHSIGHHIMYYSQLPEPAPFAKAIIESGATTARAVFHPTHPRHLVQFREFLVAAGVETVTEGDIFDRLRSLPYADLVRASRQVWKKYEKDVTWPFQPVIDGPNRLVNSTLPSVDAKNIVQNAYPVIPDLPFRSWQQGAHLRIPVLTGFNSNDGAIFIPSGASTNAEFRSFFQTLIPSLNNADLEALEELYPDPTKDPQSPYKNVPPGKGKQWARLDAAYSHYAYICPVVQTAHFLSNAPSTEQGGYPVYLYHFAATSFNGVANHGDETPLVTHDMGIVGGRNVPGLHAVADIMHRAWVRFAVFGDPNPKLDDPQSGIDGNHTTWPVFRSPFPKEDVTPAPQVSQGIRQQMGGLMLFGQGNDERRGQKGRRDPGVPAQMVTLSDFERKACKFWWDRVELSEGLGKRTDLAVNIPLERQARAKL